MVAAREAGVVSVELTAEAPLGEFSGGRDVAGAGEDAWAAIDGIGPPQIAPCEVVPARSPCTVGSYSFSI